MKEKITTMVYDSEQFDEDWPPENIGDFAVWLEAEINNIPEEYRVVTKIKIDGVPDFGDEAYANITISYERRETDNEEAFREGRTQRRKEAQEKIERGQLAVLKAKYENDEGEIK